MPRRPPSHSFKRHPKASVSAQRGVIHPPKAEVLGQKGLTRPSKASARALSTPQANFQRIYNIWLQSYSVNTRRAYACDLKALGEWQDMFAETELMELLSDMTAAEGNIFALEWQNELVSRKLSPATVNRMLAAFNAFLKLLRMNGWITWTVEIRKRHAKAYKDTKGCGVEEVEAAIQKAAREDGPKPARDEAVLRLLWGLGLRRSEVAKLEIKHLNFKSRKVLILGKGRHEAEALDLTEKMVDALHRWIGHRGNAPGALFCNFSRADAPKRITAQGINRITHRYGLGHAHRVRHASITHALNKTNGDVRTVMRFSRHKDLNTLMIYDDNRRDGAKKISEALEEGI